MKSRSIFSVLLINAALVLIMAICTLFIWHAMYPSVFDPKSPQYVFWKMGLPTMHSPQAQETMVGDSQAKFLVIGKDRLQLERKFGRLLPFDGNIGEESEFLRSRGLVREDVARLEGGIWVIVFQDGRASELVLWK